MDTSNYGWGLPIQASTIAAEIDFGINLMHWIMLAIFVGWGIFFTYLLIRYRKKEGVRAEYHEGGTLKSLIPDALVLVIEILLVVFYAIPGWARIKLNFPKPEDSNNMRIVAEQFAWNIQYPGKDGQFGRIGAQFIDSSNVLGLDPEDPAGKDDIVTLNDIHIPVGKPTLVELSSKDVIHSFFIPEFRIKQDATPGMKIPVWFEPTKAGKYELACAQLCGNAHASMRADVIAETQDEFAAWLKSQAPSK